MQSAAPETRARFVQEGADAGSGRLARPADPLPSLSVGIPGMPERKCGPTGFGRRLFLSPGGHQEVPVGANWARIPPCPRPRPQRLGTGHPRTVPALLSWIFLRFWKLKPDEFFFFFAGASGCRGCLSLDRRSILMTRWSLAAGGRLHHRCSSGRLVNTQTRRRLSKAAGTRCVIRT